MYFVRYVIAAVGVFFVFVYGVSAGGTVISTIFWCIVVSVISIVIIEGLRIENNSKRARSLALKLSHAGLVNVLNNQALNPVNVRNFESEIVFWGNLNDQEKLSFIEGNIDHIHQAISAGTVTVKELPHNNLGLDLLPWLKSVSSNQTTGGKVIK